MLALTTFKALGHDPAKHLKALAAIRWPGRMEFFGRTKKNIPIFLSGDHNPAGVDSLLELLPDYRRNKLHIVVGLAKDKDRDEILQKLFNIENSAVYLTETTFKKTQLGDYGPWLKKAAGKAADPSQAISLAAQNAMPDDIILVTGSLYLVGKVKTYEADSF
jgi:dihydrofolate synthase/folylpolyglutamate synthase